MKVCVKVFQDGGMNASQESIEALDLVKYGPVHEVEETVGKLQPIFSDETSDFHVWIYKDDELHESQDYYKGLLKSCLENKSVFKITDGEYNSESRCFDFELYKQSPEWVSIILNLMKRDTLDYQQEFGDFITRSLVNRMNGFSFDKDIIGIPEQDGTLENDELRKVLESERYVSYNHDSLPQQYYTGDLFTKGSTYYLNIRAQCDLSRPKDEIYNPDLYLIKGKKLRDKEILMNPLKITEECRLDFGNGDYESLENIVELCSDQEQLNTLNHKIQKHQSKTFLRYGAFIERADKVIVGCIAGEKTIQFSLDITVKNENTLDEEGIKRIGRLLPPYITRVQQKCFQYMTREGVMPIPEELYE